VRGGDAALPKLLCDFLLAVCCVQLSGGELFVGSAIAMLKRRCIHQLTSNVSLYSEEIDLTRDDLSDVSLSNDDEDDDTGPLGDASLEWIQRLICVDQCQPHGHCHNGLFDTQCKIGDF